MSRRSPRPAGMAPPPGLFMLVPRRLLRHVPTLLRNPRYFKNRLLVMLYQLTHPGHPWLTAQSIRFLENALRPEMVGFEWGSGLSTLWFASKLRSVTSIEHDKYWFDAVVSRVRTSGLTNIDLRLAQTDDGGLRYVQQIQDFPDRSLDFILVDGEYRDRCLAAAVPKLRPKGCLVVDNEEYGYDFTPCTGLERIDTTNGVWSTVIFRRPGSPA